MGRTEQTDVTRATEGEEGGPETGPSIAAEDRRGISRRVFVQRSVAGGAALSLGALLAACGGGDDSGGSETSGGGAAATTETPLADTGTSAGGSATTSVAANTFEPAAELTKFTFSFAIPKEDSENTAYYVNKEIFGPNEGIDLDLYSGTSTSDFIKLVADHKYDAAHPSVFLMALMKDQELPVSVYFDNMNINIFGFAVKPDSPIKAISDLGGKKIAIAVVGWDALWNPITAAAGVDNKSITWQVVGLGTPARLNVLDNGDVDAIVTWNGEFPIFDTTSQLAGHGELVFLSGEAVFPTPANGWAAAEDRLEPDRDLLVRAARAQARAMYFVRENPTEAAKIFHKYYPDVHNAEGQAEAIAADYNNTGFTDETDTNGLGWNSDQRWQNLLDSMYQDKLTKKQLQAADMFTNDMIAEINDFDVDEVIAFAQGYTFEG